MKTNPHKLFWPFLPEDFLYEDQKGYYRLGISEITYLELWNITDLYNPIHTEGIVDPMSTTYDRT